MGRKRLGEERGAGAKPAKKAPRARAQQKKDANRAARVLEIMAAFNVEDRYLGNAEIAERTGIPRPTVSRITATLVEEGYLNYQNRIGKYEVGPRVLALSYSLMARLQIYTRARPFMEDLAREARAIVGLGILDGLNVVFIECAMGDQLYSQRVMVGFRVPVAFTSIGWSCLSAMNSPQRAEALQRLEAFYPTRSSEIASNVKRAIADVWERGFCISEGAFEAGANAVSVPFLDKDGQQILAFNMIGSDAILTRRAIESKWGPRLVKMVEQFRAAGERSRETASTSRARSRRIG
ncbi:IclR family transcriptional regulator [Bradyrhizobium sp. SSUT18]|uniref:IclR family transcriptional regulator n=1 Tax=Bradyrhizobium sp. SSUT18 TaxID=3040602 RepID=UPI00244C8C1E|nr:IclR family transcriptional regulator [Bradyrhizobium sp. SSUT18]MDH2401777.1 IclR family transcriptional regulator [Bradyrhizobium sp. SSUT18]